MNKKKEINWLGVFVFFAGGTFLTSMIVPSYPIAGSFIIGIIMAIMSIDYHTENNSHLKTSTEEKE